MIRLNTIQWKACASVFISTVKLDVETLSGDLLLWMEAASLVGVRTNPDCTIFSVRSMVHPVVRLSDLW